MCTGQLPRPTPSRPRRSVLEGGASSGGYGFGLPPPCVDGAGCTGAVHDRGTIPFPGRYSTARKWDVGGIQTGWLRHAHLIDSDLHSIPVRGAEKPAPVGAGWHARFDGPVLGGWLTGSPYQPTLLADWHYYGVGSHTSKSVPKPRPAGLRRLVTTGSAPLRPSVPTAVRTRGRGFRLEPLR